MEPRTYSSYEKAVCGWRWQHGDWRHPDMDEPHVYEESVAERIEGERCFAEGVGMCLILFPAQLEREAVVGGGLVAVGWMGGIQSCNKNGNSSRSWKMLLATPCALAGGYYSLYYFCCSPSWQGTS
jgi:hypothetical protein